MIFPVFWQAKCFSNNSYNSSCLTYLTNSGKFCVNNILRPLSILLFLLHSFSIPLDTFCSPKSEQKAAPMIIAQKCVHIGMKMVIVVIVIIVLLCITSITSD